jgi:hypothetical protein
MAICFSSTGEQISDRTLHQANQPQLLHRYATRERDQSLARALAELEASEFPEFAEAAVDRPTADFLENILAPLDWTPRKQAAE